MNTRLSIVLPLRGREEFTTRFLRSAQASQWRYWPSPKIIVADGSECPQQWQYKSWEPINFGNIDYFYAGYDVNLSRYWHKMVIAFDRVETPYAMVTDNDDMVCSAGLHRCCDWLDNNRDYVAISGRIQGFWYWPDQIHGPRRAFTKQYARYDVPADYAATDVNHRVLSGFQNSWSYYAIYRTEALKLIWQELKDLDLSDLQLAEKFCAMRALSLGKIKCDGSFTSMFRQYSTSMTVQSKYSFGYRLLRSNFSRDRECILNKMKECGVDMEELRSRWEAWYDDYLRRDYGWWPMLRKAAKRKFPRLAFVVQNRHRYLPMRWSYR